MDIVSMHSSVAFDSKIFRRHRTRVVYYIYIASFNSLLGLTYVDYDYEMLVVITKEIMYKVYLLISNQ